MTGVGNCARGEKRDGEIRIKAFHDEVFGRLYLRAEAQLRGMEPDL